MFSFTNDSQRLLFPPPPVLGPMLEQPMEDLSLLRDEMYNLAWAVERVVSAIVPLNRHKAYHGTQGQPSPPAADDGAPLVPSRHQGAGLFHCCRSATGTTVRLKARCPAGVRRRRHL